MIVYKYWTISAVSLNEPSVDYSYLLQIFYPKSCIPSEIFPFYAAFLRLGWPLLLPS